MLSISVQSCPICYQSHEFAAPAATGTIELLCPTFGETFSAEVTATARPLPVHLFGRQGSLALPVR